MKDKGFNKIYFNVRKFFNEMNSILYMVELGKGIVIQRTNQKILTDFIFNKPNKINLIARLEPRFKFVENISKIWKHYLCLRKFSSKSNLKIKIRVK